MTREEDGHPAPLPVAPTVNGINDAAPLTSTVAARKRHRGSISISRVGTVRTLSLTTNNWNANGCVLRFTLTFLRTIIDPFNLQIALLSGQRSIPT